MYLNIDQVAPERIAAYENGGRSISYGELVEFCSEDIPGLEGRSVVFLLCANTIGSLSAYLYCMNKGLVPLMLGEKIERGLLDQLLDRYAPSYLWVPAEKAGDFPSYKAIFSEYSYTLMATGFEPCDLNDDLALLMTTSGSTGSPKLVRYRRDNLEANAKNVASAFSWTADERPICDLQMNYTMGLNVMNTHLFVGATLLLTTFNLMSSDYWDYVKSFHATNFTGVPFSYDILRRLHVFDMDLPSLTTFAAGGGRLSDEVFRQFAEYADKSGKRFFSTFGTTETAARMAYLSPDTALQKTGSIGKAIPQGELFLVDDEGRVLEGGDVEGELCYRGPNVTMGYAMSREDLSKGDEFCGEYHTGDVARRDDDGFYFIVGRRSRFLKLLGYRVGLDECERMVSEQFHVPCACTGNDEKMLVCIESEHCDANEVKSFLSNKTGIYRSLFDVVNVEEIPRDGNGKTSYRKLAEAKVRPL